MKEFVKTLKWFVDSVKQSGARKILHKTISVFSYLKQGNQNERTGNKKSKHVGKYPSKIVYMPETSQSHCAGIPTYAGLASLQLCSYFLCRILFFGRIFLIDSACSHMVCNMT